VLLEAREGEVAFVPTAAFKSGLKPTQADLDAFYAANKQRYVVPEQRVLRIAKIGPEQVASVQATTRRSRTITIRTGRSTRRRKPA